MKSRIAPWCAVILAMLLSTHRGLAQSLSTSAPIERASSSNSTSEPLRAFSSANDASSVATAFVTLPPPSTIRPKTYRPFSSVGIASHTGLAGAGFDVATPLAGKFNIRGGSDFFSYATTFQQQGANVAINLRMRSSRASLDWFPFGGRFRLSPLMVFANNNRVQATALIPSGSTVTLNGQDYISSLTDPMHGSGRIDFRKISPGFTFGFGNIIPRTKSRISVPVEVGFYYVGQPRLQVSFSGSACDPTQPPSIGCQSVTQDAGFQQNLAAFIARNNNNLSYASFLPILSIGFGYAF